jgi:hypothetical protein
VKAYELMVALAKVPCSADVLLCVNDDVSINAEVLEIEDASASALVLNIAVTKTDDAAE